MTRHEQVFVETVWNYYRAHGRHDLPWRNTTNPYRILVSEIMLQQTQVERVTSKYRAFLRKFPCLTALARTPLSEVLIAWQGLGYNRRAKLLHECAQAVVRGHKGKFPQTHSELIKLPGIGQYTAGALLAFAFGTGEPIIETNIRSVYLHHFYKNKNAVTDVEILAVVARTLDHDNPREWYYALMDYGVYIKKTFGNPNLKSKHYTKQSRFKGSNREIRGALIRVLSTKSLPKKNLCNELSFPSERITEQLSALIEEGLVVEEKQTFALAKSVLRV